MTDDSPDELSSPSKPSVTVAKHIYFDEDHHETNDENTSTQQKIIERPVSSTVRMDGSDLISRCQNLIPLLSDTNAITTDKDQSNEKDEEEFHLPVDDDDSKSEKSAKESGEASSSTDEEVVKKKRKKKKKKKKKKLKPNDTDIPKNNPDLPSQ
ncbi:unnamed protein product [Adineta ricciae]|uniref:Uncharacterized protein n=1 Tax=Adineta ricciae TaxID=249248 RepID=A0A816FIY3_ADIRI|nr:unnamed protein product [Adineta ricciae]CAF1662146.1 unnamed protein product [Adineta ricciae]